MKVNCKIIEMVFGSILIHAYLLYNMPEGAELQKLFKPGLGK